MPDNAPYVDPHCGYTPTNCPWGDACADCGRYERRDHESRTPEEAGRLERDRDPIQPRWVNGMPRDPDEIPSKDEL